jgi:hypothetical protein
MLVIKSNVHVKLFMTFLNKKIRLHPKGFTAIKYTFHLIYDP